MDAMGDLLRDAQADGGGSDSSAVDGETPWPGAAFFAINPEADGAVDALQTARLLSAENGLTGVPYPSRLLHVSLLGIGRRPGLRQEAIERACVAAAAVTIRPFEVAFDRAASFRGGSKRPLVLFGGDGVAGIQMLQTALISELEKVGFSVRKHSYEPHMTLLYDRRRATAQYIAPVRWKVREFSLIHSLHGLAQHVRLARWTL
jgi:2'-5' RNA ligase